jgi:hypothetical protein
VFKSGSINVQLNNYLNTELNIMTTYTRLEAAQQFNVSNTIIARNLKSLVEMGFEGLTTDDNKLTERAIYLIELFRNKDFSMLDDELDDRLTCDPLQSDVCDHEPIATDEPIGLTAGIALRTESIHSTALATSRHTDELRAFEIPTIEIEDVSVDVEELRSLLGLSTTIAREADAYREQAQQHRAELETLQSLQEQLDIARIVADEQAKIAREQAIRDQVRKSELGKQIKAHAAVA